MMPKRIAIIVMLLICFLAVVYLYLGHDSFSDEPVEVVTGQDIFTHPLTGEAVNLSELIFEEKNLQVGLEAREKHLESLKPPPPPTPASAAAQPSGGSESVFEKERQMISLINHARESIGLPRLHTHPDLTTAARTKSKDMALNNYFSHTSPTFGEFTNLLRHFGISYMVAGENLAMNSSGSVMQAHESLMNSPGHRANILDPAYSTIGVGIYVRGDGRHYYTQLFVGN